MAEGNIEVTVAWAPSDGVRMLLERATEVQRAFAEQNGLQIRGLTLGA